ncbi:type I DNA topoisomerase [Angustibacter sp. Root456]|uniref:type I DNA topoisomerase n=1 Tax=Angustibacter sp. Root456 TaxID=1736539 RepID=UPI0006F2D034|nr:type I DNA topoisomerase [Angustibacter sp. Root456]KQX61629.1 DNA topoisomerase I [Angustibacter sp. Root456]
MATSSSSTRRRLVIVESPAKAKTIAGYLGEGYDVEASVGHIRDLPQPSELPSDMKKGPFGKFAVDVDHGFEPYYVVDSDKKKKVAELKRLLKDADELYLATDEDREGEAIAWHLLEALQPKVPVKRMVFHEITREALQRALETTRDIDDRLVDAQETRRILDRLYGYEVSPVLWRKVRRNLSAGRVQSVATRLVVERERERMAFRAASYWDLLGNFAPAVDAEASAFTARLTAVDGARVATGKDFDDLGRLKDSARAVVHLDESAARSLVGALESAPVTVRSVEEKPYTRRPAAPFTTSTLQQEASRKLRFSSRQAMRVAQSLYENGYITYMRTDSTVLSNEALTAARSQAADLYGPEYVPDKPRVYASKSKNAQEAHEAIRPAGDRFRTPAQVSGQLRGDEFRLYELIWKRTVASQMADARGSTASVRLAATASDGREAEFSASGTVITFRGFLAAYEEGRDEQRGDDERDAERRLPQLAQGDAVTSRDLEAVGHETSPPPRYTEASLVKALEERGIGRPSTYASTISTIIDRGYVWQRGNALVPSWVAFAVTRLMEEHFGRLVDYDFTAAMESDLDRIADGEEQRSAWLQRFYFGDADSALEGLRDLAGDLDEIDAREISTVPIGEGVVLRVGRYGPYVEVTGEDGEPRRATVPDDVPPDELTVEMARELLTMGGDEGRVLGDDPASGRTIVVKAGRYGPYVTELVEDDEEPQAQEAVEGDTQEPEKPAKKAAKKTAKKAAAKPRGRTASLFKDMSPETVTLEDALRLLSLPRVVGVDPESGEEITAQNGRYGPYLKKGTDSRSLASESQLFDLTLAEALAIYAQPKRGRGQAATAPLRELGDDPVSGGPVVVKEGRFGPYVTDGEVNATLRKDDDPESITLERAAELLADKRARGPVKKRGTKKAAAKKTTAKKATAKKTTAKKTTAKKTTAKKST